MTSVRAGQGWPDDQGQLKLYTTANPAAGAEFTYTVPTGLRWRVIGITARIVTSIAVGNRLPTVVLNNGSADFLILPAGGIITASMTRDCTWLSGVSGYAAGSYVTGGLPVPLIVGPGYVIKSVTEAIQTGDDWAAANLIVMEWPDA